jgi:hypothetical protein
MRILVIDFPRSSTEGKRLVALLSSCDSRADDWWSAPPDLADLVEEVQAVQPNMIIVFDRLGFAPQVIDALCQFPGAAERIILLTEKLWGDPRVPCVQLDGDGLPAGPLEELLSFMERIARQDDLDLALIAKLYEPQSETVPTSSGAYPASLYPELGHNPVVWSEWMCPGCGASFERHLDICPEDGTALTPVLHSLPFIWID